MTTRKQLVNDEFTKLYNIIANQLTVSYDGLKLSGKSEYAKVLLLKQGYFFYNSFTDDVYTGSYYGNDEYGRPDKCTISTENGYEVGTFKISYNSDDGIKLVCWSRDMSCVMRHIEIYASELADCRLSTVQNLVACRSPRVWKVRKSDYKQTIREMVRESNEGEPNIVVDDTDGIGVIDYNYVFLAPQFHDLYRQILSEFLEEFGYPITPNKRERVQSDEITANAIYSNDHLTQIAEYINDQCVAYNVPIRVSVAGSIGDIVEVNNE